MKKINSKKIGLGILSLCIMIVSIIWQTRTVSAQPETVTNNLSFATGTSSVDKLETLGYKWDRDTYTLTIRNMDLQIEEDMNALVFGKSGGTVTLVVEGDNTIKGGTTAIVCDDQGSGLGVDLVITGSGTLTVINNITGTVGDEDGIRNVYGNISIEQDVTVTVECKDVSKESGLDVHGILVKEQLDVLGSLNILTGSVTGAGAGSNNYGIYTKNLLVHESGEVISRVGGLELYDSEVYPIQATGTLAGIYVTGNAYMNGKVEATSGQSESTRTAYAVSSLSSYGIYCGGTLSVGLGGTVKATAGLVRDTGDKVSAMTSTGINAGNLSLDGGSVYGTGYDGGLGKRTYSFPIYMDFLGSATYGASDSQLTEYLTYADLTSAGMPLSVKMTIPEDTLYYDKSTEKLYVDEGFVDEYQKQSDLWSGNGGVLTLESGFSFTTSAKEALVMQEDTTITVNGTAQINTYYVGTESSTAILGEGDLKLAGSTSGAQLFVNGAAANAAQVHGIKAVGGLTVEDSLALTVQTKDSKGAVITGIEASDIIAEGRITVSNKSITNTEGAAIVYGICGDSLTVNKEVSITNKDENYVYSNTGSPLEVYGIHLTGDLSIKSGGTVTVKGPNISAAGDVISYGVKASDITIGGTMDLADGDIITSGSKVSRYGVYGENIDIEGAFYLQDQNTTLSVDPKSDSIGLTANNVRVADTGEIQMWTPRLAEEPGLNSNAVVYGMKLEGLLTVESTDSNVGSIAIDGTGDSTNPYASSFYGIYLPKGDIDGSITVKNASTYDLNVGIYVPDGSGNELRVRGGTIDVLGVSQTIGRAASYGIHINGAAGMVVEGGIINLTSDSYPLKCFSPVVLSQGLKVMLSTVYNGKNVSSAKYYDGTHDAAEEVYTSSQITETVQSVYIGEALPAEHSLYFNKTDEKLYQDASKTEYTGQMDKWEIVDGKLILKDGFYFATTAASALILQDGSGHVIEVEEGANATILSLLTGGTIKSYGIYGGTTATTGMDLTIQGKGTLYLKSGNVNADSYGLYTKKITIVDATVYATGGDLSGSSKIISAGVNPQGGDLTLKGCATLYATGGDISANTGSSGSTSARTSTAGIYDSSTSQPNIVIDSMEAKVIAQGGKRNSSNSNHWVFAIKGVAKPEISSNLPAGEVKILVRGSDRDVPGELSSNMEWYTGSSTYAYCQYSFFTPGDSRPAVGTTIKYLEIRGGYGSDKTLYYNKTDGKLYTSSDYAAQSEYTVGAGTTWQGEGSVLTLSNFQFSTSAEAGLVMPEGTTIQLASDSENLIEATGTAASDSVNHGVGILAQGNLSIEGEGQLSAVSGKTSVTGKVSAGIYVIGEFKISQGNVIAIGGGPTRTSVVQSCYGVYTGGNLTLSKSANLLASSCATAPNAAYTAEDYGIKLLGELVLESGNLTAVSAGGKNTTLAVGAGYFGGNNPEDISEVEITVTSDSAGKDSTLTYTFDSTAKVFATSLNEMAGYVKISREQQKEEVTITADKEDSEYDGSSHIGYQEESLLALTENQSTYEGELEYSYSGRNTTSYKSEEAPVNAGEYTLTISVSEEDEIYTGKVEIAFEITKKELTWGTGVAADKTYDGENTALESTAPTLSGILAGDEDKVRVKKGSLTFADVTAGSAVAVTASGYGIEGALAGNYVISGEPAFGTARITKKVLTAVASATNRAYDGTDNVLVVLTPSGVITGDDVTLTATGTAASSDVGEGILVSISDIVLGGGDGDNYEAPETLSDTIVDIGKAVYTGSHSANINILIDEVTSGTIGAGLFELPQTIKEPEVKSAAESDDTNGILEISGLSYTVNGTTEGQQAECLVTISSKNHGDFTVTLTFTIVKKNKVTISGIKVDDKEYDGQAPIADMTDLAFVDAEGNELNLTKEDCVFHWYKSNDSLLTEAPVVPGDYYLVASIVADHADYAGTVKVEFTINKASLTVKGDGNLIVTKEYDGTNNAGTLSGSLAISEQVGEDDVAVSATAGSYDTADAGEGKEVLLNLTLEGDQKDYYTLAANTYLFMAGEIRVKEITISGVTAESRDYDGTKTVNLSGGSLEGAVASDIQSGGVEFTLGKGTLADAHAGEDKTVAVDISLKGNRSSNYRLVQPLDITVTIGKATPDSSLFTFHTSQNLPLDERDLITLAEGVDGLGEASFLYYRDNGYTNLVNVTDLAEGIHYVKMFLGEGKNYKAVSEGIELGELTLYAPSITVTGIMKEAVEGSNATLSFQVTHENLLGEADYSLDSLNWYGDALGTASASKPAWAVGVNYMSSTGILELTIADTSVPGKYYFSISLGDSESNIVEVSITEIPKTAPTITTKSLNSGVVDTAYSEVLKADGTTPITWTVSGGDAELPEGLSLNSSTGEISGTPTVAGNQRFTVVAQNVAGSDSSELAIVIKEKVEDVSGGDATVTVNPKEGTPSTQVGDLKTLLNAALTDGERQRLNNQEISISLELLVSLMEASESEALLVNNALGSNQQVGMYLDISLLKRILEHSTNDTREVWVNNLDAGVELTIEIPEELRKDGRRYFIIHVHEGEIEILYDLDNNPDTLTIKTDKFSLFALSYEEKIEGIGDPNENPGNGGNNNLTEKNHTDSTVVRSPKTGGESMTALWILLIAILTMGIISYPYMNKKKR
ncbi:YDG domain-containing protein [Lachnospiraceae bacterium OttesenSCG-928-D06]|nr:YDG domain-containing protein [Lachnospiraceae bacterium OttesenSCG-928-D06]